MWRTRSLTADGGQSVGVWDRGRYRGRIRLGRYAAHASEKMKSEQGRRPEVRSFATWNAGCAVVRCRVLCAKSRSTVLINCVETTRGVLDIL